MKSWTLVIILTLSVLFHYALRYLDYRDRNNGRAHEMMMELCRQGRVMPMEPKPRHNHMEKL